MIRWHVYILSVSFALADRCARQHGLRPREWIHLHSDMQLRGIRDATVWYCDDFIRVDPKLVAEIVRAGHVLVAAERCNATGAWAAHKAAVHVATPNPCGYRPSVPQAGRHGLP